MNLFVGVLAVGIIVGMWLIGKGAKDCGRVELGMLLLSMSCMFLGLWITETIYSNNAPAPVVMAVDTLSRVSSVDTVTVIQYTLSD